MRRRPPSAKRYPARASKVTPSPLVIGERTEIASETSTARSQPRRSLRSGWRASSGGSMRGVSSTTGGGGSCAGASGSSATLPGRARSTRRARGWRRPQQRGGCGAGSCRRALARDRPTGPGDRVDPPTRRERRARRCSVQRWAQALRGLPSLSMTIAMVPGSPMFPSSGARPCRRPSRRARRRRRGRARRGRRASRWRSPGASDRRRASRRRRRGRSSRRSPSGGLRRPRA